jgi:hypothetical protein
MFHALVAENSSLKDRLSWAEHLHDVALSELREARAQIIEMRDCLDNLRAARLDVQKAEQQLQALYRERAIARAKAIERDPAALLQ